MTMKRSNISIIIYCWIELLLCQQICFAQNLPLLSQTDPTSQNTTDQQADNVKSRHQPPGPTLDSPQAAMHSFLQAMVDRWSNPKAYQQAIVCMDFSLIEPIDDDDKKELADQLYGLINRIEYVRIANIPDAHAVNQAELKHYTFFPRKPFHNAIEEKVGGVTGRIVITCNENGRWVFSSQTVQAIADLYNQMQHLPLVAGQTLIDRIEAQLPAYLVSNKLLNIKYWQWIGIFLAIMLGLAFDLLVRMALMLAITRFVVKQKIIIDAENTKRTLRPFGLLAAGILWLVLLQLLGLSGRRVFDIIHAAAIIFTIFAGTLAAWRLTDLICEILIEKAKKTKTKFDDVLIPLLRKTTKIFIVIYGVIYVAQSLDIPIGPMLASLGISSLAFAFAAKDTVENFFGSIAVLLDRPFDVGDWVVVDGYEGIVEEVGFRSTRIRTFYNSQVTMPNSNLVRATVDNFGRRKYRRWKTTIGVQYDTPPDKMIAFVEGIRELVRNHPYTRKDYYQVWFNDFGDSSLNILLYIFHEVPDWSTELRERERMFIDIVRLADQLGVSFAFPTQTIHLYKEEHQPQQVQHDVPQSDADHQAMTVGVRTAQQIVKNQPWRYEKPSPVTLTDSPTTLPTDAAGNPINKQDELT